MRLDPRDFIRVRADFVQIDRVRPSEEIARLEKVNVGIDVAGQMNLPEQSRIFASVGGLEATLVIRFPSMMTTAFGITFSSPGLTIVPLTNASFSARNSRTKKRNVSKTHRRRFTPTIVNRVSAIASHRPKIWDVRKRVPPNAQADIACGCGSISKRRSISPRRSRMRISAERKAHCCCAY